MQIIRLYAAYFQGFHGWIEACGERQSLKSNSLRVGAWLAVTVECQ